MGKKSKRRPARPKHSSQNGQVEQEEANEDRTLRVANEESIASPERPPSIHELDDLEAAVAWMMKGRVDTKGFARHLPHTSQALQEGKVSAEEVADDLEEVYNVRTCRIAGHDVDPVMAQSHLASMSALPQKFFRSEDQWRDISITFSADLQSGFSERFKAEAAPDNVSFLLSECVNETCEKWAPRLDRELFGGRKGTFLKRCPLYGINHQEYHNEHMPIRRFVDGIDIYHERDTQTVAKLRKRSLAEAARNVASGLHDISKKCWECLAVCDDLKKCSNCKAAEYCSRECQTRAWKRGHKHKCELLGHKYAALDDALQTMDEYHNNVGGFFKNGYSLSDELDFRVLDQALIIGLPLDKKAVIEWGIPSMLRYYENLEKVARGEIWFYPNANEERYKEAGLDSKSEFLYFLILSSALSFDYDLVMKGFVQKVCIDIHGGVQMPASVFIDIYFRRGQSSTDRRDRFRLRREWKRSILQHFVEKDHA